MYKSIAVKLGLCLLLCGVVTSNPLCVDNFLWGIREGLDVLRTLQVCKFSFHNNYYCIIVLQQK